MKPLISLVVDDSTISIRELQKFLELDLREEFRTYYVSGSDVNYNILQFLLENQVLERHGGDCCVIDYVKAEAFVAVLLTAQKTIQDFCLGENS